MIDIDAAIAEILRQRAMVSEQRSLLVGISGIDGSGKGYLAQQLVSRLALRSIIAVKINVDGWLNLPDRRFDPNDPAQHFYANAIRFEELFAQLVIPLRNDRSINIVTDFAEETARTYRKHSYRFRNVDVILLEGVFLFRRDHRELLDLAIWIDCSFSTALARALTRKQEGLSLAATIRAYETIYFPAQKIHLDKDQPREGADLILANDPYLRPQSFCQRDVPLMTTTRRGNEL